MAKGTSDSNTIALAPRKSVTTPTCLKTIPPTMEPRSVSTLLRTRTRDGAPCAEASRPWGTVRY